MPAKLVTEDLLALHDAGDRFERLAEAADVAAAEARRAKGELDRMLRHLRRRYAATDERLGIDPITGEWKEQGTNGAQPPAPAPKPLPLFDESEAQ